MHYSRKKYSLFESEVFLYDSTKKLFPATEALTSSTLIDAIKKLEDSGIADWAVENRLPTTLPNISASGSLKDTSLIIVPLIIRDDVKGMFTFLSRFTSTELDAFTLAHLTQDVENAAIALYSIFHEEGNS